MKDYKLTNVEYKAFQEIFPKKSKDYIEKVLINKVVAHKEFGIKVFYTDSGIKYWEIKKRKFLEFDCYKPVYVYSTTYGYEYHSNVDWNHPEYGKFGKFNDEIVFNFKFDGYRSMVSFVKL